MEKISSKSLNLQISPLLNLGLFKLLVDVETLKDRVQLFYLQLRKPGESRKHKVYHATIDNGMIRPIMHPVGKKKYRIPEFGTNMLLHSFYSSKLREVDIVN